MHDGMTASATLPWQVAIAVCLQELQVAIASSASYSVALKIVTNDIIVQVDIASSASYSVALKIVTNDIIVQVDIASSASYSVPLKIVTNDIIVQVDIASSASYSVPLKMSLVRVRGYRQYFELQKPESISSENTLQSKH